MNLHSVTTLARRRGPGSLVKLLLAAALFPATVVALQAATLSGIGVMGSTEGGAWTADSRWNTIGGDTIVSLYVVGSANVNDPFINGPSDAQAAVSIPLGFGTHTFTVFLVGGIPHTHHAMNLFFNGQNINPGISVFGQTQVAASPPFPPFFVNLSPNSQALGGQTVPAAGTLTFQDATSVITLTDFRVAADNVYNLDRAGFVPFSFSFVGADGRLDRVGQFTLTVVPVPEPGAWLLSGLGAIGMLIARVARRHARS